MPLAGGAVSRISTPVTLSSESREIEQVSNNVSRLAREVQSFPPIDAVTIPDVVFAAGVGKNIAHGLGRPWQGWIPFVAPTSSSAYIVPGFSALTDGLTNDTHFAAGMQNACTVSILVW